MSEHIERGRYNLVVVAVNNEFRFRALPGARTPTVGREGWPNAKLYAWLNYGGILGDVRLEGHSAVYLRRQFIRSELSEALDRVSFEVLATVQNDTDRDLWELDDPVLYSATARIESDAERHQIEDRFGIRTIEARDGRLYLIGRVVRLAGANRTKGHPVHGGRDPDELVFNDLALMKAANLRLTRIQHTPPGKNLLRWADENRFLLILEVGMWGYTAPDQASQQLRDQFRFEMRQMIESSANHPSVIGWSLGNEYESWLPEGIDWTRDMARFVRSVDPTRLLTFNTLGTALRELQDNSGGEHAFDFIDLIMLSAYFATDDLPAFIDPVNERWPDKPVFIGEYGRRADQFEEKDRITHFDEIFSIVRERPWICGFSYWAFNDYRSRYPGSGMDGYRRWGVVDEHRIPRSLYFHMMRSLQQSDWMTSHPPRAE